MRQSKGKFSKVSKAYGIGYSFNVGQREKGRGRERKGREGCKAAPDCKRFGLWSKDYDEHVGSLDGAGLLI